MFASNAETFLDAYYLCVSSDVNKPLADLGVSGVGGGLEQMYRILKSGFLSSDGRQYCERYGSNIANNCRGAFNY